MKCWQIAAILLSCLTLVGSVACSPFGGGGGEEEVTTQEVEVARGDLIISVSGSGSIDVSNETELAFDGGGEVGEIYVEDGDEVSQGDLLAVLVPFDTGALELILTQARAALEQALVALETAEFNLEKAENPFTDEEIEDAEDAVDEAEDYLDYAKDMLREAQIDGDPEAIQQWEVEVYHAQMNLDIAEAELEQMEEEPDEDEIELLEMQVDAAEWQVDAAEQALEEAQRQLEIETITAPFDGLVASIDVEEGDIIPHPTMAQATIIHLIDPTSMELSVELDEIDIPGVGWGQRAVIEVDALPTLQLEGRVASVSPVPMVETGVVLYRVKIGFDVPQGAGLRIGMSATADIILNERINVLLVPDLAISHDSQGNPVVYVMVNEQIEQRSVGIGISDGFQTEILDGLDEGEIVLVDRQLRSESGPSFLFGH